MSNAHPSFETIEQEDFARDLSRWVAKRIDHEGRIFGLPPVPRESNPPKACYKFGAERLTPSKLAGGLVDLVLWMAWEEAGNWLKSTIEQEGFVHLRPFLEGHPLFSVIAETRSEVERSDIIDEPEVGGQ